MRLRKENKDCNQYNNKPLDRRARAHKFSFQVVLSILKQDDPLHVFQIRLVFNLNFDR